MIACVSACGSESTGSRVDPSARVVELPGASREIDFDDIIYSRRLQRVLVPARRSGLYLIDPRTAVAKRVGRLGSADSADEGERIIFVAEREKQRIHGLDAATGRTVFSAAAGGPIDYVRYLARTRELWVTEPGATPPGIEIFALGDTPTSAPARAAFIPVPEGPEAITVAHAAGRVYVHAADDLATIAVDSRSVTARWPSGCDGTHGFPQIDERHGLLLASCARDGEVSLLGLDDGRVLGHYAAGEGEALPAFSAKAGHVYVRGDPGSKLVTLQASRKGLAFSKDVVVPRVGHCLTADDVGHYWTCDADHGRVLRFDDP